MDSNTAYLRIVPHVGALPIRVGMAHDDIISLLGSTKDIRGKRLGFFESSLAIDFDESERLSSSSNFLVLLILTWKYAIGVSIY